MYGPFFNFVFYLKHFPIHTEGKRDIFLLVSNTFLGEGGVVNYPIALSIPRYCDRGFSLKRRPTHHDHGAGKDPKLFRKGEWICYTV